MPCVNNYLIIYKNIDPYFLYFRYNFRCFVTIRTLPIFCAIGPEKRIQSCLIYKGKVNEGEIA